MPTEAPFIYLDDQEVKQFLNLEDLVPAVRKCLADYSSNQVVQPVRIGLPVSNVNGNHYAMSAYYPRENALVTKIVNFFPENKTKGLSTHLSEIILMDPDTGSWKAIMNGDRITEWRTAAASVVATEVLANSTRIVAIIGSGNQGNSHARLIHKTFGCSEIRVHNHNMANAHKLVGELKESGLPAIAVDTVEEAVKEADVIVTATSSSVPVLKKDWLKEGAHVNAVGACRPNWQELDSTLMQCSSVWVDSRDAALKESGDIILSKAEIQGEIGDLVNQKRFADKHKITVFKSLGIAAEDAATAAMIYRNYLQSRNNIP